MGEMTEEDFRAARERGRLAMMTKPRALSARYDPASAMISLELSNDCTFAFPARRCQGLEQATDQQLAEVETMGVGFGLGWDELDAHLTVEGLMAGRFGSQRYMERLREDASYVQRVMRQPFDTGFGQAAE